MDQGTTGSTTNEEAGGTPALPEREAAAKPALPDETGGKSALPDREAGTRALYETGRGPAVPSAARLAWGVPSKAESRWPASAAIAVAIILYLTLPERYTAGPSWLMPALELAILVPLTLKSPYRVAREGRLEQALAVALIAIVNVHNLASLVLLVDRLLYHGSKVTGPELLWSSLGIWLTNVIVYALWYWEIDRGGPHQRVHENHSAPDFLFPQMNTPGCSKPDWTPGFVDYVYLAFTNATAFSPTDAMPLTPVAKALMLSQSVVSLVTISFVAARAVNILN